MSGDSKPFRPMLAGRADLSALKFPVYASCKLDGVRCVAMNGKPMSRTLKIIRNRFVQAWFAEHADKLEGFDGELIVGDPTHKDVYRTTNSGVMSEDGEPDFTYWVFDLWNRPFTYEACDIALAGVREFPRLKVLGSQIITAMDALEDYERLALSQGYEGVMLRGPSGLYKQGRSSVKEGILLKLKRYEQDEARIVGFEELYHNDNEAQLDERGYTKRTSHLENQVGMDTLGALVCEGVTAFEGVRFRVGTGFTQEMRKEIWQNRNTWLGKLITYKHFAVGVKDAPRHPVYLGLRDEIDIGE